MDVTRLLLFLLLTGCAGIENHDSWYNDPQLWPHITKPGIATGPGYPSAEAKKAVTGK